VVPDKKCVKQTKIVPKRIKFFRKNYIVIPILSVISDGGAETDQRGAETEKFVPKTPKLEVPKKCRNGWNPSIRSRSLKHPATATRKDRQGRDKEIT
jgi:hypothetical protein